MPPHVAFRISVPFGWIAWGTVTVLYIWPALRGLELSDAVRPLLVLHSFRYVGPCVLGARGGFPGVACCVCGDLLLSATSLRRS